MLKRADKVAEWLVRESPRDYPGNFVATHIGAASQVQINPQLVVICLGVLVIHCIALPTGIPHISLSNHKMQSGKYCMLCRLAQSLQFSTPDVKVESVRGSQEPHWPVEKHIFQMQLSFIQRVSCYFRPIFH